MKSSSSVERLPPKQPKHPEVQNQGEQAREFDYVGFKQDIDSRSKKLTGREWRQNKHGKDAQKKEFTRVKYPSLPLLSKHNSASDFAKQLRPGVNGYRKAVSWPKLDDACDFFAQRTVKDTKEFYKHLTVASAAQQKVAAKRVLDDTASKCDDKQQQLTENYQALNADGQEWHEAIGMEKDAMRAKREQAMKEKGSHGGPSAAEEHALASDLARQFKQQVLEQPPQQPKLKTKLKLKSTRKSKQKQTPTVVSTSAENGPQAEKKTKKRNVFSSVAKAAAKAKQAVVSKVASTPKREAAPEVSSKLKPSAETKTKTKIGDQHKIETRFRSTAKTQPIVVDETRLATYIEEQAQALGMTSAELIENLLVANPFGAYIPAALFDAMLRRYDALQEKAREDYMVAGAKMLVPLMQEVEQLEADLAAAQRAYDSITEPV